VLTPQESDGLFRTLAELRAEGLGIVLITHKLREALGCADRIAVMRQGRIAGTLSRREATEERLLTLMFGESIAAPARSRRSTADARPACALELKGVSTASGRFECALKNLSLKVHCGEIVGVAGVSGGGQRELADVVLGLLAPTSGRKLLWDQDATKWPVAKVRESGVAAIPDDPLALACIPGLSVRENLVLGTGRRYDAGLDLDWERLDRDVHKTFARFGFPRPPLNARAATLSGGNLQRVVLARELASEPKLLVALYPTRGLDVRSAMTVRALLSQASDDGAGVLIASEDLDELFAVSDRLVVLHHGAIAGEFLPEHFHADAVGRAMVGLTEEADAA
jgi:ABC-type uncharacterized transport system ATPase subunit